MTLRFGTASDNGHRGQLWLVVSSMMAAMAARLTRVRGSMTDAEFGQLLADVVRVAERFGQIDVKPGAPQLDMPPDEILRLLNSPHS